MKTYSPSQMVSVVFLLGLSNARGMSAVGSAVGLRSSGGGTGESAQVLLSRKHHSLYPTFGKLQVHQGGDGTANADDDEFWERFLGNLAFADPPNPWAKSNSMSMSMQPTSPPTYQPSSAPSPVPTAPPTQRCELEIDLECIGCNINTTDLPLCLERTFIMGFLFRGGNCSENTFDQPPDRVTCIDYNGGPPKQASNELAYIRANIDPKDKDDGDDFPALFEGTVQEGSYYFLYTGSSEIGLPADTQIRTWSDATRSIILQDVRFHASCSQPMGLTDTFGAHMLVQFENNLQGNVSLFTSTRTDFNVSIPITLPEGAETLRITNATIRTNYTDPPVMILPIVGDLICSEEVANDPNQECNTTFLEVEFETTLSLADPQGYLQQIAILATAVETGQFCFGIVTEEFFAPANLAPSV